MENVIIMEQFLSYNIIIDIQILNAFLDIIFINLFIAIIILYYNNIILDNFIFSF